MRVALRCWARGLWYGCDQGAVCTAMLDLYQNEGIIAEPAGALSVAGLLEADIEPGSTVVCLISGGNNDVSRYGEVLERSLVHLGLKHYFLVDFPQEPGALRRFLDEVLGPDDDIVLFEYVKRDNRETGAALTGIEIPGSHRVDAVRAELLAGRPGVVHCPGCAQRTVAVDLQERMDLAVDGRDPVQVGLGHFDGRGVAGRPDRGRDRASSRQPPRPARSEPRR